MENAPYLTPKQAADLTGYSVGTLANLRSAGAGPRWVKPRGGVRYPADDLRRWMEERG